MSISKKPVAIVSGASRGIGKAIAERLQHEGYVIIGLYKSSRNVTPIEAQGIEMHKVDVSVEDEVRQIVRYAEQTYGRIDVVVNNAGINIFGDIASYDTSDWNKMFATNLTSVFFLSKYSTPLLKLGANPNIINISSRRGVGSHIEPGFVAYSASKAAVNTLTLGLAKELNQSGVRVNAVIPTPTKTDLFDEAFTPEEEAAMRKAGIVGTPHEVAELVVDIINDRSLNGQLVFDTRVAV